MSDLLNDTRCRQAGPVACRDCDLYTICKLTGLIGADDTRARHATGGMRVVGPGASLYEGGMPAGSLFAIREGMIKLVELTADGEERVVSFHTPGEVLGLEAFSTGTYNYDAIALGSVRCCELPVPTLSETSPKTTLLATELVQLLSHAIATRSNFARGSARQRVGAFLIDLGERMRARGFDGDTLTLKMSREEIANLLDTRIETISRTLQQLKREGAIEVRGGRIRLLDVAALDSSPALEQCA